MKDDVVYLKHILDSMDAILNFVRGKTYNEFVKNRMMWSAVIREIEVVGEATKNLSYKFREKYPEIPWRKMAGMRDVLIHGYFKTDLEAVWKTAVEDIPNLKSKIEKIIKDF
ncbi:DUF86 domain-containing protein [Thermosipho ferrireducens]|uniref:DUF86 domain-containing protein n=1 Tax=Thermosipho ferrireducens TaxID=2571116 RepID=A0ABX7S6Y9_9BACT|nr:DUF86 domain-containing protein [Thermosipho ferrireducens]QTA38349.1 DUF86 domain-containing protein [Thermosipho ferrireducens]